MKRWDYSRIVSEAEAGNPHQMIELANLYKAGVFGDSDYDEYIFWLRKFFETPIIKALVENLADHYIESQGDEADSLIFLEDTRIDTSFYIPPSDEMALRQDIIEAGISLGIYFKNSSKREELDLSLNSLVAALDASAWDSLEYYDPAEGERDILSLIWIVKKRKESLGFGQGDTDE